MEERGERFGNISLLEEDHESNEFEVFEVLEMHQLFQTVFVIQNHQGYLCLVEVLFRSG